MESRGGPSAITESLLFSADQVRLLTGLSLRQLQYWDDTGFFSPEHSEQKAGPFVRVYSFRDVVGLYTIGLLRKQHKVPLQNLRLVGAYLSQHHDTPWSGLTLYVRAREVIWENSPGSFESASHPGQGILTTLHLQRVARQVEDKVNRLRKRERREIGSVRHHRHTLHNATILAGTRVPTSAIWSFHEAGYDADAILREYPRLEPADVARAIALEKKKRKRRSVA